MGTWILVAEPLGMDVHRALETVAQVVPDLEVVTAAGVGSTYAWDPVGAVLWIENGTGRQWQRRTLNGLAHVAIVHGIEPYWPHRPL